MRIGIDARLFYQTNVCKYITNLIKNLQEIDYKNDYVLFVKNEDYENVKFQISSRQGRNKFQIIKADIKWHSIEEQIKFPYILERENLDLVHFPYFSVPILYKRPYIITIHDLIIHHFPTGKASTLPGHLYILKILVYKYVIKRAAQKAKKVISVSNSTKEEIMDHLKIPQDKIKVIYEAADQQISNPKSQIANKSINTKSKIQNPKYFLFVGNVYPHKNTERMIKAFEILLKYFPDTLLFFAGKQDYFYTRLEKIIKDEGLANNVRLLGFVQDENLAALYKNAVALVVPSLMEGFGLPALEAMANKCLVLASSIPALKEVCQKNAIYFDPYDIDDIAGKMKMAYLKDFDGEIIERAFERSKELSCEKMAEETLRVYENMGILTNGR